MPTNQLMRVAGKIAGLAGLAIAMFLLIFQGIIQFTLRGAISNLTPASSFAVLNSLMSFTFGIAAIVGGISYCARAAKIEGSPAPIYALCLLIFAVFVTSIVVGFLSLNRVVVGGSVAPSPPAPEAQHTTEFVVCVGEYAERCPPGSVHLGCGSSVDAWAATQCTKSSSTRLSDLAGNRCGYYTAKVVCQKKL